MIRSMSWRRATLAAAGPIGAVAAAAAATPSVRFVNASAPSGGDGLAWATAFQSLDEGLAEVAAGAAHELWIAAGTYVPTQRADPGNPRSVRFAIPPGASLLGGFAGHEKAPEERDWWRHPTVFSGDVLGDDAPGFANRADNAYHVLVVAGAGDPVLLDGLQVRGGAATGAGTGDGYGAGLRASGAASTVLRHCRFFDHLASSQGGALRLDGGVHGLDDCVVEDSSANGGGALHAQGAALTIEGCTFAGNVSALTIFGGAVAVVGGAVTVTSTVFVGNQGGSGAGMAINPSPPGVGATATITDCVFSDNGSSSSGGGLMFGWGTKGLVDGCTFVGNASGQSGGGAWVIGKPSLVSNCIFSQNAAREGGGVAVGLLESTTGDDVRVADCVIDGNIADQRGGGCFVSGTGSGQAIIERCVLRSNFSIEAGGGILSEKAVTLRSTLVAGNWAPAGGGCLVSFGTASFDNVTIVANQAGVGGGVRRTGGTTTIAGSILWQNVDASGSGATAQLSASSGAFAPSDSCVEGWTPDLGGTNVIAQDPRFVDPLGGDGDAGTSDDDLSLRPDSPCINRADLLLEPPPEEPDLLGAPRQQQCRVDMGAIESPHSAPSIIDCNGNGVSDECDLDSGSATDCDTNGVPDSCDIASGQAADCDGNGVPDTCQADCDGDGLPDPCEIAAGSASDCDGDGVPDACQIFPETVTIGSPQFSPFGNGAPAVFVLRDAPPPTGGATFSFAAVSDLGSSNEAVNVTLDGVAIGTVFGPGGNDCPAVPNTQSIVVAEAIFLAALGDGSATIAMTATTQVSATQCAASFIQVTISYPTLPPQDLDLDGVLDRCAAAGDLDGDGAVGGADLGLLLNAWGLCGAGPICAGDLDGDGLVGGGDLGLLLGAWSTGGP